MREGLWKPRFAGPPGLSTAAGLQHRGRPVGPHLLPGHRPRRPKYAGHFFITHFKGSIARSGIQTYTLKQNGATFTPTSSQQFMGGVLPTDVTFGPDGKLYLLDWVDGWPKSQKGRIYGITPVNAGSGAGQDQRRPRQTTRRPASRTERRRRFTRLLSHPDRRARLEAQLELASRGESSVTVFTKVANNKEATPLARLHAVWGLTQLGRKNAESRRRR